VFAGVLQAWVNEDDRIEKSLTSRKNWKFTSPPKHFAPNRSSKAVQRRGIQPCQPMDL